MREPHVVRSAVRAEDVLVPTEPARAPAARATSPDAPRDRTRVMSAFRRGLQRRDRCARSPSTRRAHSITFGTRK
jgi:hypothetical protein